MKKLCLFFTIFSYSLFAQYEQYDGDWKGSGKFIGSTNSFLCESYQISINIRGDSLKITDGQYTCKRKTTKIADRNLFIKGNDLLNNNDKIVGSISLKKIIIKDSFPSYELFISRFESNLFVIESDITTEKEEIMIGILD